MPFTSAHYARIKGPIGYETGVGDRQHLPLGPCLIEGQHEQSVSVVWGERGHQYASLPLEVLQRAWELGHLVLIN